MARDKYDYDEDDGTLGRQRRRRIGGASLCVLLILAVALAPSVISYSPLGDSILRRTASEYGWQANALGISIGWFSPAELENVELVGASGYSKFKITRVSTSVTVFGLLTDQTNLGTINVSGLTGEIAIGEGVSSIEQDLATLSHVEESVGDAQTSSRAASANTQMTLVINSGSIAVHDVIAGDHWVLDQIKTNVVIDGNSASGKASCSIKDPNGALGTINSVLGTQGALSIESQITTLPLSILRLVARRFPSENQEIPSIRGSLDGVVSLSGDAMDNLRCDFRPIEIRGLVVNDSRISEEPVSLQSLRLQGSLLSGNEVVQGADLKMICDFGTADFNGTLQMSGVNNPNALRWLESLSGTANLNLDIARLNQVAPGLLPLRDEAIIESAVLRGSVTGSKDTTGFLTNISLETDPIIATSRGRSLSIEPMTVELSARPSGAWILAEHLQIRSMFASATASGGLEKGQADFNVDLGRLATMISPLVDLPAAGLGGSASGNIRWAAGANDLWKLSGQATASELAVTMPGGQKVEQSSVDINIEAAGTWAGDRLSQLNAAKIELQDSGQTWNVALQKIVENPTSETLLPLVAEGNGQLTSLAGLLRPWLPSGLGNVDGRFQSTLAGEFALATGVLRKANVSLDQPFAVWSGTRYAQPTLNIVFDGKLPLGMEAIGVNSLLIQGSAAAINMQGDYVGRGESHLEFGWRVDLKGLRDSQQRLAHRFAPIQLTNYAQAPSAESAYAANGMLQGTASLAGGSGKWNASVNAQGQNLELLQRQQNAKLTTPIGPEASIRGDSPLEVLWEEPTLNIAGNIEFTADNNLVTAEELKVSTQWTDANIDVSYVPTDNGNKLTISGPAKLNNAIIARRLETLVGQSIQMTGSSETPIDVVWVTTGEDQSDLKVTGELSWESANVAGVAIGPASLPIKLEGGIVELQPTTLQLAKGLINIDAQAFYEEDPMRIEQRPGKIAENVQLEAEMTRGWLKYVAPLVADATQIDGTFSLQLDKAIIYPMAPEQSIVNGQLLIERAQVGPGPITNNLIGVVSQMKSLTRSGKPITAGNDWVELPSQTVDFVLERGRVTHQRLLMQLDDVYVISGGTVTLDGQLQLMAQIPIEDAWAGGDLRKAGMIGQAFTVPIDGTLSRPSLDSRGMTESVARLGIKALEETTRNALQKEISRGLQKIFGR